MVRILVIEDDDQQRAAMCQMLVQAGHEVSEAADGAQGLALFRREPTDLVVTDIFMPEADGFEVIQLLKRDVPNLPILAVSGGTTRMRLGEEYIPSILCTAVRFGASHALRKPFEDHEFLEAVEALVAREAEQSQPGYKSRPQPGAEFITEADGGAGQRPSLVARYPRDHGSTPTRVGEPGGYSGTRARQASTSAAGSKLKRSRDGGTGAGGYEAPGEAPGGGRSLAPSSNPGLSGKMEALALLTAKERQVVEALLAGMPLPRIAREGGRSPRTIRNQLASVFRKLGVHSQVELLAHLRSI